MTVRCDEVETIEFNRDKGIGITVYSGQRKGLRQHLRLFGSGAARNGRGRAEHRPLHRRGTIAPAWPTRPDGGDCPDLDLYHPWALSVEEAIELPAAASRRLRCQPAGR